VSTPRSLDLPDLVQRVTIESRRGCFAALEAQPTSGVCERRPALIVPGFTGSKEDFIPVLRPLASAGRRIVAIDMRGQYQSPAAPGPDGYAPGALAADLAAVAEAIAPDLQGVHLVGHSLGGLIAREAALAGKARIVSLTLLGTGPGQIHGERAEMLRAMLALMEAADGADADGRRGDRTGADQRLRATVGTIWDDYLEPEAKASGVPEPVIAFLHRRMMGNCPTGLMVMGRYLLTCPDRTAELAGLGGPPILVLYGEDDDAWDPAVQERMARRLGAQRVCIPGAGHSPAVEAPETTASTLTGFWRTAEEQERRRVGRAAKDGHRDRPGPPSPPAPESAATAGQAQTPRRATGRQTQTPPA
jgi:pimeloyl-ACP methyl ester carboxylesterase